MAGRAPSLPRLPLVLAAALTLVALRGETHPAFAADFTVDSTADAIDASPGDGACDDGAGTCTLRAAIQESNALPGPDTITLPDGIYALTITGDDEDASAKGDLDITDDLTITGAGADTTVIDGMGLHRAFHIISPVPVHISDLSVRNGHAGDAEGQGGGINNELGDVTLTRVAIYDSEAPAGDVAYDEGGGGFANAATALLNRVLIRDNFGLFGGGILNTGSGTLDIIDSAIFHNRSWDRGGAFANLGVLTIKSSAVYDNVGGDGAASGYNVGTLEVINSTITGNHDLPGSGGHSWATNVTVINSTVAGNSASGCFAGVFGTSVVNSIVDQNCCLQVNSLGHNIYVMPDSSCAPSHPTDIIVNDPLLRRVQGPIDGHVALAPMPGSPAIDGADDSACPSVDQLGSPRPRDGDGDGVANCDIGAVEVQDPLPLSTPGTPPATPVWNPPLPLNTNAMSDSGSDGWPDIDTDGSGNWVAVWASDEDLLGTGDDEDIFAARSSDNGLTWSDPVLVNSFGATDSAPSSSDIWPSIATDGSGVWIAAWSSPFDVGSDLGDVMDIFFARSLDNGATWSAAQPLNTDAATDTGISTQDHSVHLAAANGTWVATWDGFEKGLLVARSTDGMTWSDPVLLYHCCHFRAAVATDGEGNWMIVWDGATPESGPDFEVFFSRSTDDGATWSEPGFADTSSYFSEDMDENPYVAADSEGNWIVAWVKTSYFAGLEESVVIARSSDLGQTWSAPEFLTPAGEKTSPSSPRLATDGSGTWTSIWVSGERVRFAQSQDDGVTWTDPAPIRPPAVAAAGNDVFPTVVSDGSARWVAAWSSTDTLGGKLGDDRDILYSLLPPGAPAQLPGTGVSPRSDARWPAAVVGALAAIIAGATLSTLALARRR